jgi:hypothetical protein
MRAIPFKITFGNLGETALSARELLFPVKLIRKKPLALTTWAWHLLVFRGGATCKRWKPARTSLEATQAESVA